MTTNPENPPAFPTVGDDWNRPHGGMTLRDYFAASAMQGLIARGDELPQREEYDGLTQGECYADMAYAMADAMLKARAA